MKEHDIRHEALFKCYLKLSQQDVECCFGDDECQGIPCVACDNVDITHEFTKDDFGYSRCTAWVRSIRTRTPRFLQRLVNDDTLVTAFQGFLTENRLSTRMPL